MVVVDMQVAVGLHRQIEQAMPRNMGQHMIEEADASRYIAFAFAVEPKRESDVGFIGFTTDACGARRFLPIRVGGDGLHQAWPRAATAAACASKPSAVAKASSEQATSFRARGV